MDDDERDFYASLDRNPNNSRKFDELEAELEELETVQGYGPNSREAREVIRQYRLRNHESAISLNKSGSKSHHKISSTSTTFQETLPLGQELPKSILKKNSSQPAHSQKSEQSNPETQVKPPPSRTTSRKKRKQKRKTSTSPPPQTQTSNT